uniref:GH18 domain-containing protein n=1 Tax=Oryza punctata TaxID=4537 RepID=A0A0E0LNQ0_ORYPU
MALTFTRRSLVVIVAALLLQLFVLAGLAPAAAGQTGKVTVFWGRNKDEGTLREACDTGMYTMVVMSFLNVYGSHGEYRLDLAGHPVGRIGGDVKHCQRKGVLVSLAIGGPGPSGAYSLQTNQSALDLFDHLWNTYLAGGSSRKDAVAAARPFGDAVLDGVDFFLDHATPAERYDVLAMELAKRSNTIGKPPLHLTATTRCAFPDPRAARALATGAFERVHVRFYGEDDGDNNCTMYWEDAWDRWTAAYPRSRIYFGLPAAAQDGRSGYVYPKTLYYRYVPELQKAANYGGFMIWDRYSDKQSGYSSYVKNWA